MTVTDAPVAPEAPAVEQGTLRLRANREIFRIDVVEADVDKQVFLGFLREQHGPDATLDAATAEDMREYINEQIIMTSKPDGGVGLVVLTEGDEQDAPEDGWTDLAIVDLDAPLPITADTVDEFFRKVVASGRLECVDCTHNPAAIGSKFEVVGWSGKNIMIRRDSDQQIMPLFRPMQLNRVTALTARDITIPGQIGHAFYGGTITWGIAPEAGDR